MTAKNCDQVQSDIKTRFKSSTGKSFSDGSAMDLYTYAVSKEFGESYSVIENNKNPHIFSRLSGQELDDTGYMINCPREVNESDTNYFYRLMNWTLRNEASNDTAIQDSILNLTNASNAKYISKTKGVGTGSVYIIPTSYDDVTKAAAIKEVKEKISASCTSGMEIEYIIPTLLAVKLMIYVETKTGDLSAIKASIQASVQTYVNAIAPSSYLEVGKINSIGINTNLVTYFNVVGVFIDNIEIMDTEVLQEVETKLIFNEIEWVTES